VNWYLIIKDKSKQPETGIYSDWKEQIAEECFYQCIYCSIHEVQFGGIDHYHIEHYKPKSLDKFKELENDIMNLFYSCPICNRFKSNDWPNDADDLETVSYPDPSEYNYNNLFEIDEDNYKVIGKHISTSYMTERLYLNRPQLIYERRESFLKNKEAVLRAKLDEYRKNENLKDDLNFSNKYLDILSDLTKTLSRRSKIRPYKLVEIRK